MKHGPRKIVPRRGRKIVPKNSPMTSSIMIIMILISFSEKNNDSLVQENWCLILYSNSIFFPGGNKHSWAPIHRETSRTHLGTQGVHEVHSSR